MADMHLLAAFALFGFVLLAMVPTFHCSFVFGLRSRTHHGNHGRHHSLTGDPDRYLVRRHSRNTFTRDIEGPREYVHHEDNGEVSSEAKDNGAVSWTWTPRSSSIGSHWKDIGQPYICWFLSGHSILELPYFLRQWCQHKSGREPRNTAESSSSGWPWKKRWSSRFHNHRSTSHRRYRTGFNPYNTLKKPCMKTTPWTLRRRTTTATKTTTIAPTTPAVSSTSFETETTPKEMTGSTTNNPTTTNNPVTTTNNPVTTTDNPVTTTNNPVTTTNSPVTTTDNPVTTTNNPDTTTNSPVTTTNNPVTTTNNPVTTTNNPVTTTNNPDTTTNNPDTTTSNPVTTTNDPTTETSSTSTVTLPFDRKPV